MRQILSDTASAIGRGLAAGAVGTVAMTASSTLEAKLRGRGSSDTPSQAVGEVLGVDEFEGDAARARTNQFAHWGYGTSLGAIRGLLGATGLHPRIADLGFYAAVQGTEQVMMPALDLAPPARQWGGTEVATDVTHHVVYAFTTNAVYRWLSR